MHSPSAKVVASTLAALLMAAAVALADDGIPHTLADWLALAAKILAPPAVTGAVGYMKAETNPAPSALETLAARGRR